MPSYKTALENLAEMCQDAADYDFKLFLLRGLRSAGLTRVEASDFFDDGVSERVWKHAGTIVGPASSKISRQKGQGRPSKSDAVVKFWTDNTWDKGGQGVRAPKGESVRAIAERGAVTLQCSTSTIYKYAPALSCSPWSDLCPYCERGRALVNGRCGEQYHTAEGALTSCNLEKTSSIMASGTAEEREEWDAFLWHHRMKTDYPPAIEKFLEQRDAYVFTFDYAAPLALRSQRGDSFEFFSPKLVDLLGVVVRNSSGILASRVVVFPRGAKTGAASSRLIVGVLKKLIGDGTVPSGKKLIALVELDTASHFRCSMVLGVAEQGAVDSGELYICYQPEYHGKSSVDALFGRYKSAVRQSPTSWFDLSSDEILERLKTAYCTSEDRTEVWSSDQLETASALRHGVLSKGGITSSYLLGRNALSGSGVVDYGSVGSLTQGELWRRRTISYGAEVSAVPELSSSEFTFESAGDAQRRNQAMTLLNKRRRFNSL